MHLLESASLALSHVRGHALNLRKALPHIVAFVRPRGGSIPIPEESQLWFIGCSFEVNESIPLQESQFTIYVFGEWIYL